jgi:hypothetical protein
VHDIFICVDCERDAKQLIEIQDDIWSKAEDEQGTDPGTCDEGRIASISD